MSRRMLSCPKRSRPVRSPSLLWARSREANQVSDDNQADKFGGAISPRSRNRRFLGNMVYADTVDRNFLAGGVHSHRQNDYRKCSVADENPDAGVHPFYASISLALFGKEVAGIFSQCGGLSSHHRCAADYSA